VDEGVGEAANDPRRPERSRRPRPLRVALLLGFASFVLHMGLADWLAAKGALRPINLFFDADCGWFLDEFATGDVGPPSYGPRCLIHPNVANLIEPPIAFAAAAGDRLVGGGGNELLRSVARRFGFAAIADSPDFTAAHALRTAAAVAMAPLAAAVRTVFLYLALDLVGLAPLAALLATLLCTVSASGLVFGAIPESFGMSGAVFAWVFHLVARAAARSRPPGLASWIIAGTLASSITLTNVAAFGLAATVAFHAQERHLLRAFLRATGVSLAALLATGLIFLVLTPLEGGSLARETAAVEQAHEIMPPRNLAQATRFAGAVVDTLAPPLPATLRGSFDPPPRDARVVRFTFRSDLASIASDDSHVVRAEPAPSRPWRRALASTLIVAALLFALARLRLVSPPLELLTRAALVLLAFNALFHATFGYETFLYSQHWLVALILVLSVGMAGEGGAARLGRLLVGALIVLAAIHSIELFTFIGVRI
jgi:hypothetical protein